jgi:hypothetical protein
LQPGRPRPFRSRHSHRHTKPSARKKSRCPPAHTRSCRPNSWCCQSNSKCCNNNPLSDAQTGASVRAVQGSRLSAQSPPRYSSFCGSGTWSLGQPRFETRAPHVELGFRVPQSRRVVSAKSTKPLPANQFSKRRFHTGSCPAPVRICRSLPVELCPWGQTLLSRPAEIGFWALVFQTPRVEIAKNDCYARSAPWKVCHRTRLSLEFGPLAIDFREPSRAREYAFVN